MTTVELIDREAPNRAMITAVRAALICTDNESKLETTNIKDFLNERIWEGHLSILEHIVFSFKINNISRALLQELARHRHISMSVKSTRHTLKKSLITKDKEAYNATIDAVQDIVHDAASSLSTSVPLTKENNEQFELCKEVLKSAYRVFLNLNKLAEVGDPNSSVVVPDFLKYFLPECMPTSLILTVNARELMHIFGLRSHPAALLEFRRLVKALYMELPESMRFMFEGCLYDGTFTLHPFSDDNDDIAKAYDADEDEYFGSYPDELEDDSYDDFNYQYDDYDDKEDAFEC